jgi:hypothetical protein
MGGQHHAPTALPPGKTRYPLYRSLGGPQGRSGRVRKASPPPGFDFRTVQPVVSRYTDWATRPASPCGGENNFPLADHFTMQTRGLVFVTSLLALHNPLRPICRFALPNLFSNIFLVIIIFPCNLRVRFILCILCTILYCTVLYCTVLCCTVLYCTVLYCTVLLQPGVNPIGVK